MRKLCLACICQTMVILLLFAPVASADDPTRIQYQGYLTEAGGPMNGSVNLVFRLYTDSSTSGPAVWGESHENVQVNNGVYSVLLGEGLSLSGSPQLDAVDLSMPELWLEVSVNDTVVGSRQRLTSVFYALNADRVNGQPASEFAPVTHVHSSMDSSDGTPTNVVNVDENGYVGIGTTGPTTDLHVAGDDGVLFTGSLNTGTIPATGAGTRFMWYPRKAALRAGRVAGGQWDDALIGPYSLAMGYDTTASGWYSMALGTNSIADDYGAVALGDSNNATGMNTTAIGYNTSASGHFSTSIGFMNTSNGSYSTTMGNSTLSSGDYSMALGAFTNAESGYELVLGRYDTDYAPISSSSWDPSDRLFVIGNGISNNQRSDAVVVLKSGDTTIDGNVTALSFSGDGSGLTGISGVSPWTDNGTSIYYDSGNVGIGTATPTANLVLHAADPTFRIEADGGGEDVRIELLNDTGSFGGYLVNTGTSLFQLGYRSGGLSTAFLTVPTFGAASGYLGVGTVSPNEKLHLSYGNLLIEGDDNLQLTLKFNDLNSGNAYSIQGYDGMHFQTNGSDRMFISDAGNVGIGSAGAASTRLYVLGGTSNGYAGYLRTQDNVGDAYGLRAIADGTSGTNHYGVYGEASGATANYGIYGSASGGTTNYAGYFQGNIGVTGLVDGRDISADGATLDLLNGTFDISQDGNIGIGISPNASIRLNLETQTGWGGYFTIFGTSGDVAGVTGNAYGINPDSNTGLHGNALGAVMNYGVKGEAFGTATATQNVGIYGTANGAGTNYAGYFEGDVHVTGLLNGRDIAADGAVLDSLQIGDGADTTNDSWTGLTNVYTTSGDVSIGTDDSDGHRLNVKGQILDGVAAVTGSTGGNVVVPLPYSRGQLSVRQPSLPTAAQYVGALGYVSSLATNPAVGVYGWNADSSSANYGVYGIANGSSASGMNVGIYGAASNGGSNFAGYFSGDLMTTGNLTGSMGATFNGNITTSGEIRVVGTGDTNSIVLGSDQTTPVRLYHSTAGLQVEAPNSRFQFGSSEYIEDCGSYCLELSSASTSSGIVNIIGNNVNISGDTSITGNLILHSATSGDVIVELGEGLDYAEGFYVSDPAEIKPGTVLIIDENNPGKLTVSHDAYDTRVAGIVAGANGLGSGVRLGVGEYDSDVALAGRVYCRVDASAAGIRPGDLLTTSPTEGHAMKATDRDKAQGAILGKAMESLPQGKKGQILVLVSLQ